MANSVYFNGTVLTVPGAYSAIDSSGMATKSGDTGSKTVAIIGECAGGEPGAVQFFTDPIQARKVLKSGYLLKACEKAWYPVSSTKEGVDVGGANMIAVIRSNKATKAALNVFNTNPDKPQIAFQSKDWGRANNHQIKIQEGTAEGTKLIVVYDQANEKYENFDNLGRMFSIGYTGDAAYAELNIYKDNNDIMWFQTKIGDDAASAVEDLKIKLDNNVYKNIRNLILDLQSYENYYVVYNKFNNRISATDLDFVSQKGIKATNDIQAYNVTAVYADMAYTLNASSRLINVVSYDRAQGTIGNTEGYIYFNGGSEGASPTSWVEYFDALSNFNVDYIVPLTGDISIHAELMEHVVTLSGTMGKERRGIVGGNIGETVAEALQRARNLNSDRMQLVYGGFYDPNSNNELELYPPYILAAQHAGRAVFLPDGEAATHDVYRMSAPEYQLESGEITQLLQGGCLAFEYVLSGNSTQYGFVRLVWDLTTDLFNTDSIHVERGTGQLADSINKEIRRELDKLFTGKRTSLTDVTSAKNKVISILKTRHDDGFIVAFKDVYVTKTGGVTYVDYSVAPAEPNNFTLITGHFYSETLSA